MGQRLGELLVRDDRATPEDIQEGLRRAAARGTRLASALVELGRLSVDDAARALAAQLGVPAALARHLEGRDVALIELIPAEIAQALAVLPLAVSRGRDALVVCARDPLSSTVATLERITHRPVVLAVAPECALLPLIAEHYPPGVASAADPVPFEIDVDLDTGPVAVPAPSAVSEIAIDFDTDVLDDDAAPSGEAMDVGSLQLVGLDDLGVARDPSQIISSNKIRGVDTDAFRKVDTEPGRRRVTGPFDAVEPPSGAWPAVEARPEPRPRTTTAERTAMVAPPTLELAPALVLVHAAESRDDIVAAAVAYLRHAFTAGLVFAVRDGLAVAHAGFGTERMDDAIDTISIPLAQPSALRTALDRRGEFVGPPSTTSAAQDRFFRLFGGAPAWVVVSPVVVHDRVVHLLYGHGPHEAYREAAANLGTLATAAAQTYTRLIREAKLVV